MVLVIATIESLVVLCAGFIDFITFVNWNHLAEAMNKTEEDSENLHQQLLDREIELGSFVERYKKPVPLTTRKLSYILQPKQLYESKLLVRPGNRFRICIVFWSILSA